MTYAILQFEKIWNLDQFEFSCRKQASDCRTELEESMELEQARRLAPVPHTWAGGCSRRTSHPDPRSRRPTSTENVNNIS